MGLSNQYFDDLSLKKLLKSTLPQEVFSSIEIHLEQIGDDTAGKLLQLSQEAERAEPQIVQLDAWGNRLDQIKMSPAWTQLKNYAAENGLVAIGYERKQAEWSRVYQMALLYLFHPSSAFVSCPLAMTDGSAKLIETYGDQFSQRYAFLHLTNRLPAQFWFSGQWMTEKLGGSDVSVTETVAVKNLQAKNPFDYKLTGQKFFTSAITSEMAMTLARIEGAPAGNKGLSLFHLETGMAQNKLNNIELIRLKEKLGTRALPTAEINLHGVHARLVGGEGDGVKKIATLFNVTRIYNSVCSVAQMRRAIAMAKDYAQQRQVFGKKIIDHALFKEVLSATLVEFEGCLQLTFKLAHLLGASEVDPKNSQAHSLLRLLTPIAKLYTGKMSLNIVSEMLEVFGGSGYCEDSGLPKQLRDAQVFSIWEGTTNILSLDVIRALKKECDYTIFSEEIYHLLQACPESEAKKKLIEQEKYLAQITKKFLSDDNDTDLVNASARNYSFLMARVYAGALLLEKSINDQRLSIIARRWIANTSLVNIATKEHREETQQII